MKCPKCNYLGFETGDRCKNCGYDFSLLAAPVSEPADLALTQSVRDDVPIGDLWLDNSALRRRRRLRRAPRLQSSRFRFFRQPGKSTSR